MEPIKKLLRTPSALALVVVALITLIGVIVQSNSSKEVIRLSIDATATAEAKQTPTAQVISVTQIVTQLVQVSSTPVSPSIVLFDDFSEKRSDGLGLQSSERETLKTSVSGGHYVVDVNSDVVEIVKVITESKIRNFDVSLKLAEASGETLLAIVFRDLPPKTSSSLSIFPSGERKGEYYLFQDSQKLTHETLSDTDINEIRMVCINDACSIFINGRTSPVKTLTSIFDPSGQFRLGFSGKGTLRIDEIIIQELQ